MLEKFELGDEAKVYIREQMSEGLTLSSFFLRLPYLESGRAAVFLPPEAPAERIPRFQFRLGFLAGAQNLWTEAFIVEYLSGSDERYAIFENTLHEKSDLTVQNSSRQWFCYGEKVYYFNNLQNLDDVEESMCHSNRYPGIIVLTSVEENDPYFTDRQSVDETTLQKLAERVSHILIAAYDGEGWLVWSREQGG